MIFSIRLVNSDFIMDKYTQPEFDRSALITIDVLRDTLDDQPLELRLDDVRFTGFTHATPDDTLDGRPRVAFGKFSMANGRLIVPQGETMLMPGDRAMVVTRVQQEARIKPASG